MILVVIQVYMRRLSVNSYFLNQLNITYVNTKVFLAESLYSCHSSTKISIKLKTRFNFFDFPSYYFQKSVCKDCCGQKFATVASATTVSETSTTVSVYFSFVQNNRTTFVSNTPLHYFNSDLLYCLWCASFLVFSSLTLFKKYNFLHVFKPKYYEIL